MRKINKLGKRAAALVLAVGLTLSTAAPVLAVDADEVQTPAAQTEQQEETASGVDTLLPTERTEDTPVVVLPGQLPADSGTETPAESDAVLPTEGDHADEIDTYKHSHSNKHSHSKTILLETQAATCTTPERKKWKCWCTSNWWEENTSPALGHDYSAWTVVPATCTTAGRKYRDCSRGDSHQEDAEYAKNNPALGHDFEDAEWIVEEATCTTAGKRYQVCKRDGCNVENVDETYTAEHPALGHDFEDAEWIVVDPTCTTAGKRYQICKRDGCTEENVDPTYAEEHPALGHAWGEYVNDNKPACQQQTGTAHCTREGCTATNTKDLPNLGSDGNPLPHKYTFYDYDSIEWDGITPIDIYRSSCDYGCGTTEKFKRKRSESTASDLTDVALKNVELDGKKADEYVDAVIKKALANAQEAVKNAKTKEEAIDALDQISITVKAELSGIKINVGDLGTDVTISEKDLNDALKPLDDTVADLKDSLNDSFLSQDTVTNVVNKLADTVQDSGAQKKGAYQILYNTVYDAIYKEITGDKITTDNTQAISDMVLQLVKEVVAQGKDEETWQKLTDSLVDDALDLAVDELMKDETYAKLLQTKLGADTLDEVKAEIKKQLADDPTFMNSVRDIAYKAADNAQKRVNGGWPEDKVMEGLQKDLLPDVADLVSNQIDKLGAGASEIVDNKVSDTVHKFLPGKLGDWVSDKIGGKVSDAVTGKVNGLNKDVTDLITSSIKQFTCGKHEYGDFEVLKNPTCTEKGQKGKICKKCGKIIEKTDIPATGHTPVTDPAVAPTETTDGLTEGSHCGVCGAVLQAQEVIPMLDPTIDTWFSRAATTEADAKAAGFDSVDAANAALDAALTAAGFDPANAEHFTVQVNSSIGVLPNDRFSESGVTGKLTLPEGTRGKTAQTYYAVQMFTADTRFHKAGDVVVTPVSIDTYAKTGLQFTVYSEAVMAIAWKAQ